MGINYMLSRDKQICSALNKCNQCPIQKHIKTFISFISKIYSLISAQFHFPSYIHFTSIWVVFFQYSHTPTPKSHFCHQSLVGNICRLLVTEVPVGHFRRLIYSTPNREGPDTPLRNKHITSTQPTQIQINRVATRLQIMILGHLLFENIL